MKRIYRFRRSGRVIAWLMLCTPVTVCYNPPKSIFDWLIVFGGVVLGGFALTIKYMLDDNGITFSTLLFTREIPWACVRRIRYGGLYTVLDFYIPEKGREAFLSTTGMEPRFFKDVLARLGQAEILNQNSNGSP